MSRETDFLDLYRILGLNPGCELSEFKQAYRRKIAMMHPDRIANSRLNAQATKWVQRITTQYNAAMEFHRRYGRLPGAAAPTSRAPIDSGVRAVHPPLALRGLRKQVRARLMIALAVAAVCVLLWNVGSLSQNANVASPKTSEPDTTSTSPENTPMLTLGMSPENVHAIEGDPDLIEDDRWEYGPSWVRFEHGQVVDWYSSPLHPLEVSVDTPPSPHH
ncbi:J domain-containing protein [Dyella lipolytica]|uniref:DnaJ domain-containing protein n=1 Tax=Dyella lipolytica TaxID=1867835 RepID=A0ABW8J0F3_9GAMM|nr:J domain-containing protein [Dyella lipolytica]